MRAFLTTCAALTLSGLASAQATSAYVDGLYHQALGGATLGQPTERRLPVHNLGSSGQDGVEIDWNAATSGGAGVEMPFSAPPAAKVKIKYKGWDGLIYHRAQMERNSDGSVTTTVDFTDVGAIALRTRTYDSSGHVITDVTTDGGFEGYLDHPDCPPPEVPTFWVTRQGWVVWGCGVGLDPYGNPYPYARTVQPIFPPGTLGTTAYQSVLITGSDLPELGVVDATLGTFNVDSWGLGQAHIHEVAGTDPNDIDNDLFIDNLGSSGQDGVAIDFGSNAGSASFRSKKCPDCPPGHVTLIKFYDDQARLVQQTSMTADPASGGENFDISFSGLPASDLEVTLLGSNGSVEARYPVGGLEFGGWMSGQCPPGCSEIWQQNWYTGAWTLIRCDCLSNFLYYDNTGIVVPDVYSISIKPLGVTSPTVRQMEMTTDDASRTFTIQSVSSTTRCPGDLTGDHAVTLSDLAITLANYGATGATPGQGDMDGDLHVSLSDVAIVLSLYGTSCP